MRLRGSISTIYQYSYFTVRILISFRLFIFIYKYSQNLIEYVGVSLLARYPPFRAPYHPFPPRSVYKT